MFYKRTFFLFYKINHSYKTLLFLLLISYFPSWSQVETENQFSNEYQFNKTAGKKTAIEVDLTHTYTSGVNETNPFYQSSQMSGIFWIHYFASKKWKFSGSVAYIYNKDVPEITQKKLPEIRFSGQAIYYFIKKDYVFTNRFRIEDRILYNEDNGANVVYRFREMLKLIYPISVIKFGKGSLYSITEEEVFFKTKGATTGEGFFDRNKLTLGLGYSFSDMFQFELTYINEYLPRSNDSDKMYNCISTTLIFNDLISILKKKNGSIPTY